MVDVIIWGAKYKKKTLSSVNFKLLRKQRILSLKVNNLGTVSEGVTLYFPSVFRVNKQSLSDFTKINAEL